MIKTTAININFDFIFPPEPEFLLKFNGAYQRGRLKGARTTHPNRSWVEQRQCQMKLIGQTSSSKAAYLEFLTGQ